MTSVDGGSIWKLVVAVVMLVWFIGFGIAHVINPDWFIKRSRARWVANYWKGWNRLGFQIAGVALAVFGIIGILALLEDVFQK